MALENVSLNDFFYYDKYIDGHIENMSNQKLFWLESISRSRPNKWSWYQSSLAWIQAALIRYERTTFQSDEMLPYVCDSLGRRCRLIGPLWLSCSRWPEPLRRREEEELQHCCTFTAGLMSYLFSRVFHNVSSLSYLSYFFVMALNVHYVKIHVHNLLFHWFQCILL